MSVTTEMKAVKTISWGSIMAGMVTVLAVSILLSMLGTSLGFAMVDPQSDDPVNGAGMAVALWSLFSIVLSLLAGAFIAGRLAGNDGMIHGFLNWACALIVATVLGAMLIASSVRTAGNALGSIASVTGSMLSGSSEMIGKGLSGIGSTGQNLLDQIGLDTTLRTDNMQDSVEMALKNTDIPTLQPDYLKQQLQGAKDDIMAAARRIAVSNDSSEQVISELMAALKQRTQAITANIDQDDVRRAIAQNTDLTPAEAGRVVNNIINTRDQMAQEASQRLREVEMKIQQAQQQYEALKNQAAEKAEQMSNAAAKAALWSFFALLIGAIVSALGGMWGARHYEMHMHSSRHHQKTPA